MSNPRTMILQCFGLIGIAGVSFYYTKKGINDRRKTQISNDGGVRPTPAARVDPREHEQKQKDSNASSTGNEIGSAVQSPDTDPTRSGGVGTT